MPVIEDVFLAEVTTWHIKRRGFFKPLLQLIKLCCVYCDLHIWCRGSNVGLLLNPHHSTVRIRQSETAFFDPASKFLID